MQLFAVLLPDLLVHVGGVVFHRVSHQPEGGIARQVGDEVLEPDPRQRQKDIGKPDVQRVKKIYPVVAEEVCTERAEVVEEGFCEVRRASGFGSFASSSEVVNPY